MKKYFLQRKIYMKMYKIYISFEKYFSVQKMFVLQIKYESFLDIF